MRKSSLVIAMVAGAATSVALGQVRHPQGGGQAAVAVPLDVVQNGFVKKFMAEKPDATQSRAVMVYGSTGIEAPGYTLHNRVLVKGGTIEQVRQAAAARGQGIALEPPTVTPTDLPGWWIVNATTVREATEVAEALRATGLFPSVSVEIDNPRANRDLPTDPLVADQWHLENTTARPGDINASAVYAMGYTGAGVVVGVLEAFDDNFQIDHPDLAGNWNQVLSQETTPFSTLLGRQHPTSVAGLVAAVANNGEGGAGVAYGSTLARLRNGTPIVRGRALTWKNNQVHIQTNSWGPVNPPFLFPAHTEDDFVMESLQRANMYGRGGKGVVFVFASGNDGPVDRSDYEPLGASRLTISVGAVDEAMNIAGYSQGGTSLFATCYSGPELPSPVRRRITTTNADSDYTNTFTGTSAAAPIAAGVVALMLEANPGLTYRDVQHIIADTAVVTNFTNGSTYMMGAGFPLMGDTWWQVNGAFKRHSDEYGFGIIDAEAAVNAALTWSGSPQLQVLDTYAVVPADGAIPGAEFIEVPSGSGSYLINNVLTYGGGGSLTIPFCVKPEIRLEAIEVEITATGDWAGDVEILLISPYGTVSPLALPRPDPGTYDRYVFTTLKHWGELSAGEWSLQFTDWIPDGPFDVEDATVDLSPYGLDGIDGAGEKTLTEYRIRMYGTEIPNPEPYLCDINNQSCPGDLNGDGIVSPLDLWFFLQLYQAGDPFCDLNGDGVINYDDLLQFFNSFRPGFCPSPNNDGPGGRPLPGGGDNGRPITPGGAG
ncbi:MAG: S8 family serine peptidase [Phycisphaerales bacterium]|nr:S8 family serine peptidase [Phycisphaerales bacterium]